MSRILITGGAGFIGYHLARRLRSAGHELTLVDSFSRAVRDPALERLTADPGIELREADLREPGALGGYDDDYAVIYHLAAIIGVRHVLERPYAVLHDNAELLFHVLDFARRQRSLDRFVFFSTSEVYAGTLKHFELPVPTPETTPLALTDVAEPRTSYMLSKLHGEAVCQHAGVPLTIVRPHNFYGPRMGLAHVVPELLKRASEAPPDGTLEVYSVDHRRAFCYIDDAVEMIVRAAEVDAGRGATLNIGNGSEEVTIGDVARVVLEVVGRPDVAIAPQPPTPGSPERRLPDMARTRGITGHDARVGLRDGVGRTWDWYREHVFGAGGVSAT
jgi:nucleoside-diphosphate-sugar epimerase